MISQNQSINFEFIKNNQSVNWDPFFVSMNSSVIWENVVQNPHYPWDLSQMVGILPFQTLKDDETLVLDWFEVASTNRNITIESFEQIDMLKEYKHGFSQNPNVTFQTVLDNPNFEWDYYFLSKNKNITMNIIQENPQIEWDIEAISENENITFEFIEDHVDKIDFDRLSLNNFTYLKSIN